MSGLYVCTTRSKKKNINFVIGYSVPILDGQVRSQYVKIFCKCQACIFAQHDFFLEYDNVLMYLVDVTTVDVTAASYRLAASQEAGAAARKAEARKTREYRSKVDGRKTQLIPAAVELNGRWGDGMVSLFKKVVALATREGRNEGASNSSRYTIGLT